MEPVQSDVAFSGSYEERPIELGKLMFYQLSYTGYLNCGQVAASLETVDRPLLAVSGLSNLPKSSCLNVRYW